jgi:hypothetical protein
MEEVMQKNPVCYYYKDPGIGVEMNFRILTEYGWSVSFPQEQPGDAFFFEGNIPWPELTDTEKAVVDENYKKLYKALEEDDEY